MGKNRSKRLRPDEWGGDVIKEKPEIGIDQVLGCLRRDSRKGVFSDVFGERPVDESDLRERIKRMCE